LDSQLWKRGCAPALHSIAYHLQIKFCERANAVHRSQWVVYEVRRIYRKNSIGPRTDLSGIRHSSNNGVEMELLQRVGFPPQAVKNNGRSTASQLVFQHAGGCLTPRIAETAVLGGRCRRGSPTPAVGFRSGVWPEKKNRNVRCKFMLSGSLSARKLSLAKVQNFHYRLYYVQPGRGIINKSSKKIIPS